MKTLLKDRALRKLQWHLQVTICCFSTEFLIDHYVRTLETTVCRCTPGCGWCSTRYRCSLCYTYQYSRGVELQLHQFANGMSWTSIDPPLNFDLWPHFGKVSSCPEPARHFLVTTAHHAELRSQFRGEQVTLTTTTLQSTCWVTWLLRHCPQQRQSTRAIQVAPISIRRLSLYWNWNWVLLLQWIG